MNYEKLKYLGHPSQDHYIEEVRLCGGRGDGMRLLQVNNGNGLFATFSADRCADISRLNFRGINLSFFSPCGYAAPEYYNPDDFLRSFTAGFMTTCGLTSVGSPVNDEYGFGVMHGTIGNSPAEHLSFWEETENGEDIIKISARMEQAVLFGEKLSLTRTITVHTSKNEINIRDEIKNEGGEKQPLMYLYHCNMGYPLLDECSQVIIPAKKTVARDPRAEEGIDEWDKMLSPVKGFAEQCYYHSLKSDKNLNTYAAIYNPKLGVGVKLGFSKKEFPRFTEWKQMGERDYVLGLEPSNCTVEGRIKAKELGELEFIESGETRRFGVDITVLDETNVKDAFVSVS
ncbi:MAG: aldose 1-epimerase family protein [Acutalibacteraceae bacterium]